MKVFLIVLGCLLALLGAGCTAHNAWLLTRVDGDGFYEGRPDHAAIQSAALVTEEQGPIPIDGRFRVRAASRDPDRPIFIGVAPVDAFASYTEDAPLDLITGFGIEPTRLAIQPVRGERQLGPPGAQSFWLASVTGTGQQELTWNLKDQKFYVFVMNADGSPGVDADVAIGLRLSFYEPKALVSNGLLGLLMFAGGIWLVTQAIRRRPPKHYPDIDPSMPPPPRPESARGTTASPPPETV